MPRPGLAAVLFDWDGTLVNSAEGSYHCYARLFGSFGMPFDRSSFERTYSPDWYHTYERMGLPRELWGEADARWLSYYHEQSSPLMPDALRALARLRSSGMLLGLVTSGEHTRVGRELAAFGVESFFAALVCAEDVQNRKPHPEPLRLALDQLGLPPAAAAYVGDSPEDIQMARSAGVYGIGIPGGFPNRAALHAARPDYMAESLSHAVGHLLG